MFDARTAIAGLNTAVNVLHVQTTGGLSIAETNSILAPFKAFWDALASYRETGSTTLIGSRVLISDQSNWTKPVGKPGAPGYVGGKWSPPPTILGATALSSTAGTGGGTIPPQLASVVSWRTATAGRTGRGRTYIGKLGSNAMTAGNVTAAFAAAASGAAATLISAVSALTPASGPVKFCVWSPTLGVSREILTGSMDTTFDTMRSRVK